MLVDRMWQPSYVNFLTHLVVAATLLFGQNYRDNHIRFRSKQVTRGCLCKHMLCALLPL